MEIVFVFVLVLVMKLFCVISQTSGTIWIISDYTSAFGTDLKKQITRLQGMPYSIIMKIRTGSGGHMHEISKNFNIFSLDEVISTNLMNVCTAVMELLSGMLLGNNCKISCTRSP